MLTPRSVFQEVAELESKWRDPPSPSTEGTAPEIWHPLPEGDYSDWAPLEESWEMPEALRNVRENKEVEKPLPDNCAEKLLDRWRGKQASPGPAVQGAAHFHCYPIPINKNSAWEDWKNRGPKYTGHGMWWCSSLSNAADHYSWTTYPGGSFEQLAWALQNAMRLNDAKLAAVVCLKILDWGGVRHRSKQTLNWLDAALTAGKLIRDLARAAPLLCPQSTANLATYFGRNYPLLPMNSGSTKIFAAVAMDFSGGLGAPKQDVLILDGRVSTALGFLARETSNPAPVPPEFLFPYDDDRQKNGRRNPRCPGCAPFPGMNAMNRMKKDAARAEHARTASRCIHQVFGKNQPSAEFVSAEKALFMIGYDVQQTCSRIIRACSCGVAGNANLRPRKP